VKAFRSGVCAKPESCNQEEDGRSVNTAITRRFEQLVRSEHTYWWVFVASVLETAIVPIPIEIVLVPLMATDRLRLWLYALAAFAGCLLSAVAMYALGYFFFENVGRDLVAIFGAADSLARFRESVEESGYWAILAVGITPLPFQIAAIGAGLAQYSFVMFLLAAAMARGVRYFGLALLVWWFGEAAEPFIRRHRTALLIVAGLIGAGFLIRALWPLL